MPDLMHHICTKRKNVGQSKDTECSQLCKSSWCSLVPEAWIEKPVLHRRSQVSHHILCQGVQRHKVRVEEYISIYLFKTVTVKVLFQGHAGRCPDQKDEDSVVGFTCCWSVASLSCDSGHCMSGTTIPCSVFSCVDSSFITGKENDLLVHTYRSEITSLYVLLMTMMFLLFVFIPHSDKFRRLSSHYITV